MKIWDILAVAAELLFTTSSQIKWVEACWQKDSVIISRWSVWCLSLSFIITKWKYFFWKLNNLSPRPHSQSPSAFSVPVTHLAGWWQTVPTPSWGCFLRYLPSHRVLQPHWNLLPSSLSPVRAGRCWKMLSGKLVNRLACRFLKYFVSPTLSVFCVKTYRISRFFKYFSEGSMHVILLLLTLNDRDQSKWSQRYDLDMSLMAADWTTIEFKTIISWHDIFMPEWIETFLTLRTVRRVRERKICLSRLVSLL